MNYTVNNIVKILFLASKTIYKFDVHKYVSSTLILYYFINNSDIILSKFYLNFKIDTF